MQIAAAMLAGGALGAPAGLAQLAPAVAALAAAAQQAAPRRLLPASDSARSAGAPWRHLRPAPSAPAACASPWRRQARPLHSCTAAAGPQHGGYLGTGQAAAPHGSGSEEQPRILVTGACGQIGAELVHFLRSKWAEGPRPPACPADCLGLLARWARVAGAPLLPRSAWRAALYVPVEAGGGPASVVRQAPGPPPTPPAQQCASPPHPPTPPHRARRVGADAVVASDVKAQRGLLDAGPFVYCDVTDRDGLARVVLENGINQVGRVAGWRGRWPGGWLGSWLGSWLGGWLGGWGPRGLAGDTPLHLTSQPASHHPSPATPCPRCMHVRRWCTWPPSCRRWASATRPWRCA
jgi:hypothetical protein